MSFFWSLVNVLLTVWVFNTVSYLIRRLEVRLRARRRVKNGLCPEYAISGWNRHVDWCGRQTPNHIAHCFSDDPVRVHQQDAILREQGL